MITDSVDKKVYLLLASIPPGQVTTYGRIAKCLNLSQSARLIGRILSQLPEDTSLPWHRVVNAKGEISLPQDSNSYRIQKTRLENEGIVFTNGRIKLQKYAQDI